MAQRKHHRPRRATKPARTAVLRIDSIGAYGDGVAGHDGTSVYVPYTAPGDEVKIAYRGNRGEMTALLSPGPGRRAAPCPLFGACGGCALQHIETKAYETWKRDIVVSALGREGFDETLVAPLVACAPASRRRARFAVQRTQQDAQQGMIFGFNERRSTRIVDVASCLVLEDRLEKALAGLRGLAGAAPPDWRKFDVSVTLCDNGLDVVFLGGDATPEMSGARLSALTEAARDAGVIRLGVDDETIVAFASPRVVFGNIPVAVPPAGFLQASREGETALVQIVKAGIGEAARIADLFSGCGAFAFPLAEKAQIDAFDSDADAIAALNAAAKAAQARRAVTGRAVTGRARNLFERPLMAEELKPYGAVVFDPPRAGAKAQAEQLAASAVPRVIGVSCNPSTFARDAAILRDGGYALSQVTPVDQFVYSPHVELIGIFTKD